MSSPGKATMPLTGAAQYLPGVGPHKVEMLERLGLRTVSDVLFFFPRDYKDMSELRAIDQLREGELVSIWGTIEEVELRDLSKGRTILGVLIRQEMSYLRAVWFNQPYLQRRFAVGRQVLLSGTPRKSGLRWEMRHPDFEVRGPSEPPPQGRIQPVYSLTEGLGQSQIRRIVSETVNAYAGQIDEVFPLEFLDEHDLWPVQAALTQIHNPVDAAALAQAQRRFVYQELLVLQLALAMRRQIHDASRAAPPITADARIDGRIRRLFPFSLTADQEQAIMQITADLAEQRPMNRLLLGDVGTGKTVVAEYAMLAAVAQGFQAVMMAPTEVLARQHARTLRRDLQDSQVRITLLTGTLTAAQRRDALRTIAAGEADLVVGTQAVVQDDVSFHRLGLVVIDEQHRFGVRQRAQLRGAGINPHYLVMTATPIPRTMAMTQYGDLDVSVIRQTPPGRQQVHSYLGADELRESWWEFFRKKLNEGRQGYVITPLVDESTTLELASVEQMYEDLANGPLEAYRLDLVHGRLNAREKDAAMEAFRNGQTQVLVATSVVEVGIDVPNATIMTIENGERFGLSQLHQLRGRVSRGTHPGYLCVFAQPSAEARRRLQAFIGTTDGFELAEMDFQFRGPGDLFGTRQHGLPPLRIADLRRDVELLEETRRDAVQLIAVDPELTDPGFARLKSMVLRRYGPALDLADVG